MNKVKYKILFSKTEEMVYISHLDLMRLFTRALRRAGVPLFITCGFSPHPKMIFERALKLGKVSDNETAYIFLKKELNEVKFKNDFQLQLPNGIGIKEITKV
ncbi:MAG: TIGR03936 family radical SAM-associated protein [Candidatus Gygaella obscura]|nr:TIGR03936 family radical SAM-associated protein [Candidatus Gygaella obscura]